MESFDLYYEVGPISLCYTPLLYSTAAIDNIMFWLPNIVNVNEHVGRGGARKSG